MFNPQKVTHCGTCFIQLIMMKTMSMSILICSIMVTIIVSETTNITTDQSALLVLKSHITHDPQNILSENWSTSSSICSWVGVTCGAKHKRVTMLNLSYIGLTGTVPPQLGNLTFLVELRLENNSFHGSLPVELTRLRRLKMINFGFNNLMKGEIPSWFGLFPKLESLNLYGNQFTGDSNYHCASLPLHIYIYIYLYVCILYITGIPREIGNLTTLKELYLDYNNLKEIPKEIGHVNSLEVLSIRYNALTGPFPLFVLDISSLKNLSFTYNNLSGSLPNSICESVPNLKLLALAHNQLGGSIPSQWSQCKNLQFLLLSYNRFVGSIPRNIGNLTILKELYLGPNNLTGDVVEHKLGYSIQQLSCRIFPCLARRIVPSEIGDLQNLEVLVLQVNHFIGPMPPKFFNISSMRIIGLAVNHLSGQFPSHTSFLFPNLKQLVIGMNDFTGPILNFISNASQLTQIDIPYNSFYGTVTSKLCSLRNIQWLNLAFNNFTIDSSDNFFTSLADCKYLRLLELESNPLNAMLPDFGGNLSSSLQYFGVINCSMKGNIPKQIGSLSSLITLKLDDNDLTGSIPPTIGGLQKVQETIGVLRITLPVVSSIILILALACLFVRCKKDETLKISSEGNLKLPSTCREISHEELLEATNGFNEANLLDTGSFGSVYEGKLNDGLHVAIKVFNLNFEKACKSFDAECEALFNLHHRNLIKMLRTHNGNEFKALVLQFMPMGSLEKWLHNYLSLRKWVREPFSLEVTEVADKELLGEEKAHRSAIKVCLSSIMDLALNCSLETPETRKTIKDVLISLPKISRFLKEILYA
ncbi:hypothetical protein FEM48_ZijujUnG0079300 [Ziziphus jujuba var. spinosa]|uniref:Protein kinase domain-containing protein n=1 Tax=Ziziphus jujuba var. spinosa TaxID=714518 RepID=A0A978U8Q2_ZIZJJ|nr:hypothetical protein FEM48_ZijujUnG0079300 [Ziziphus jujuba var. spinosa]